MCEWLVGVGGLVAVGGWLRWGDDASRVAKIGSSCARFKINTMVVLVLC